MEFFQAIANMSGDSLAQHLANGISLGSLYALIAIGYTMVYGILLMINFAHGDIVMMACYFAIFGSYDCSNKLICYPYFFTLNQHKLSSLLV